MINNELLGYIKQQLSFNVTRETITINLKLQGWTDADISEAFSAIDPAVIPSKLPTIHMHEPHQGRKTMFVVICIVILALGLSAGFYFYKSKKVDMQVVKENKVIVAPQIPFLPYESLKSMTAAEYDPYLAQNISGMFDEKGVSQNLGVAFVRMGDERDTASASDFTIRVQIVPIPNVVAFQKISSFDNRSSITLKSVTNSQGQSLLSEEDQKDSPDRDIFLYEDSYLRPHIRGHINFDIEGGEMATKDVQKVEGVLHLRLPIDAKELTLVKADIGIKKELLSTDGTYITIKKMTAKAFEASMTSFGPMDGKYKIFFYDAEGKELGYSISEETSNSITTIRSEISGGVLDHVKILAAADFVTKDYPFTLTPHASTPVTVTEEKVTLTPEQQAIVKDIFAFKIVLESKDITKIIEYINQFDPETATEIKNGSAKDQAEVLGQFEMANLFMFGDFFDESYHLAPEAFEAKSTKWNIETDEAHVGVYRVDIEGNTGSNTFNLEKVNNQWYVTSN